MVAAGTRVARAPSRRQPVRRGRAPLRTRVARRFGPYLLVAPSLIVIGFVLGYPVVKLFELAFQHFGLPQILNMSNPKLGQPPSWVGLANFRRAFTDHQFWTVLWRTLIFTAVNVGATMVIGTWLAVLMRRVVRPLRLALTGVLIFVWAMPQLVSVTIWNWLFDQQFGVVNYTLTKLHLGNFLHHNWYENPVQGFGVVTCVVVWGAIPFIAITMHAALSQVPEELIEAARVDGAGAWQIFRRVTFPILRPVVVILTSLSIIWDFQVFTQVFALRDNRPEPWYYLMSIFAFMQSFRAHDYGYGAALSIVILLVMLGVSVVYVRQMVKIGDVR
ncbi:MAG: sugar ABC transporter permease [Acidothermus sp.]|nr:sugar ABC transporter permease [Acidothermus sp.]MCL6538608.1 sugar ABC transporter permease [Acidothermus sp.]